MDWIQQQTFITENAMKYEARCWCLNSSHGNLYRMEPHCEKSTGVEVSNECNQRCTEFVNQHLISMRSEKVLVPFLRPVNSIVWNGCMFYRDNLDANIQRGNSISSETKSHLLWIYGRERLHECKLYLKFDMCKSCKSYSATFVISRPRKSASKSQSQ